MTPYEDNPQVAEIKRLESQVADKTSLAQQYERMYNDERKGRAEDRANYHGRAVVGWVKSVLRILLILIWFGVVIAGIPFPVYMIIVHHTQAEVIFSWLFPLILGICLWVYLHDKE